MKKKNWLYRIFSLALVTVTLSAFAALAVEVGSANDPLVTLSYLNETFQKQIMTQVETVFNQRDMQLKQQLNDQVWQAEQKLASLPLPEADKALVMERMSRQKRNAREWRDVINSFFYRFSGAEDAKGRPLYL